MKNKFETQVVKDIVNGLLGFHHRFISNYDKLSKIVRILKDAGYKIVLTQGVYDLFHVGHKRYLEEAKKQGDILIVGVDTDQLTKKRKGPKRPFDTLLDRVEILSGLRSVDIITVRNEGDHMYKLIKLVQPHILVMSQTTEDFTNQDRIRLLKYCGTVKVLPARAATSTTAKLRRLMIDGVEQLGQRVNNMINDFLRGDNYDHSNRIHPSGPQGTYKNVPKTQTRSSLRSRKKPTR